MQSTRKDVFFVLLNKLFSLKVFSVVTLRESDLDDTQNHGLLSALLSAVLWLNVTDDCLLSHNTSWDHRRGTQGFPLLAPSLPRQPQEQKRRVIKRHEQRRTAAQWNLPAGGWRWFAARFWPWGAGRTALSFNLIHEMLNVCLILFHIQTWEGATDYEMHLRKKLTFC